MTSQVVEFARAWVASVVHHTELRARMAPTDRSMPPPVITKVMPTLTTPITAANRRMVSTLFGSANRSPAVTTPTTQSSSSATIRPRLRPAVVRSSSANRPPGRAGSRGPSAVSGTACGTRSAVPSSPTYAVLFGSLI